MQKSNYSKTGIEQHLKEKIKIFKSNVQNNNLFTVNHVTLLNCLFLTF
jgi:hypothetical protein